jgi:hypothetical protein
MVIGIIFSVLALANVALWFVVLAAVGNLSQRLVAVERVVAVSSRTNLGQIGKIVNSMASLAAVYVGDRGNRAV